MSYREVAGTTRWTSGSRSQPAEPIEPGFNRRDHQTRQLSSQQPSAQWYEEKCRDALHDSLRTAAEINELSQHAAGQLHVQSDRLQNIRQDAETISHNLDTSQYLIKGIKSWWGSMVQIFTSPPLPPPLESHQPETRSSPRTKSYSLASPALPTSYCKTSSPTLFNGSRSTDDAPRQDGRPHLNRSSLDRRQHLLKSATPPTVRDFDSEVNDGLTQLSEMLTEMHSRAVEMGNAIESQNDLLDQIHVTVNRNSERISNQKRDLDKLLKR